MMCCLFDNSIIGDTTYHIVYEKKNHIPALKWMEYRERA